MPWSVPYPTSGGKLWWIVERENKFFILQKHKAQGSKLSGVYLLSWFSELFLLEIIGILGSVRVWSKYKGTGYRILIKNNDNQIAWEEGFISAYSQQRTYLT